jgi:DNA-binding NtrC family response regulator
LLLIKNFAVKFAKEFGKSAPKFSENVLQALQSYYWPGNVRELENIIQRLVLMSEGETIDAPDLPSLMRYSALRGVGPHRTLAEVEVEHIHSVLASVDNNKTKAAQILGIDRKTLREKIKKIKELPSS